MQWKRITSAVFLILLYFPIFADLIFEKNVPEKLKESVTTLKESRKITHSFLIEMHGTEYLLIISDNGLIRRLPMKDLVAEDVLNVIETMEQELERLEKAAAKEKKPSLKSDLFVETKQQPKKEDPPKKSRFKWLGWAEPDSRFYIGLTASTEAKFTGGITFSAGVSFLRFGIRVQKGLNIDQGPDTKPISWESYLIGGQMNFVRFFNVTLSVGFDVAVYRMNEKWFEREYIAFKAEYRYKWFVPGVSISIAPRSVTIQIDKKLYTMDRVMGVFWFQFAL
ncbi:hypothetical protein KAH37_08655 [bacterium]|nr:hypothetical protein [bacterium]